MVQPTTVIMLHCSPGSHLLTSALNQVLQIRAFPSPFSNPMRSRLLAAAPPQPTLHLGSPRSRLSPWDARAPRCKVEQCPYLSSPGLNRSPSPPSPPRSAITEGRFHPPADWASPIGRVDRQSREREAEIAETCKVIGQTLHQSPR